MRPRQVAAAGIALLLATSFVACQSTQDRSAQLEKEGGKVLLADSGLKIEKESTDVKVKSATVLSDSNGSAVVVSLHNSSDKNLVDVPILVKVLDAKGKSVYTNAIPGIEPALAAVLYIPAGGDVDWVNDQVLAAGKPKSVSVKVGASAESYSGAQPEIEVSAPKIEGDPVSGIEATGTVFNRTGKDQDRLLLYAVGRSGGRVVAAGRGAIEHLKPETKSLHYDIFFIGDPTGTDLEVTEFPTLPGSGSE
ncbi:MAG TPA: hypothetical protein VIY71_07110 [Solirubrobacterales bacterium]